MPHLRTLVERHQDDPFALIGINYNDSKDAFRKGVKEFEVSWISAFQGDLPAISALYKVTGYPTYLVLDVDGKIAYRGHGAEATDEVIAKLLADAKK